MCVPDLHDRGEDQHQPVLPPDRPRATDGRQTVPGAPVPGHAGLSPGHQRRRHGGRVQVCQPGATGRYR